MASITANGIWIKEKIGQTTHIIKSKNFENNNLFEKTFYKLNKDKNLILERIEAKSADITETTWLMKDGYRTNFERDSAREDFDTMSFYSNFNKDRLKFNLLNLDTISFYTYD